MKICLFLSNILCSDSIFRVPYPVKRRKMSNASSQSEKSNKEELEECRVMVLSNKSSFLIKVGDCDVKVILNKMNEEQNFNTEDQDSLLRVKKEISCYYDLMKHVIKHTLGELHDDISFLNMKRFHDIVYSCTSLFDGEIDEQKYLECCEKINDIILTKHRFINKKCLLKYIGSILMKPSMLDLISFFKFPELIGMMICLINRYSNLRNKDILLVMIHYNAIKRNIQSELFYKHNKNIRNINIKELNIGRNYNINEGIYIHVEKIYSIFFQSSPFIVEYNKSLQILKNRFPKYNLENIIICFKMILFMIDSNKLTLFKEFFEDCKMLTSLEYEEILESNECLVCSTVGQILRKCFGIFFYTLDLLNKSNPQIKQQEEYKNIYLSLLEEIEDTERLIDISQLIPLMFNNFKENISEEL